MICQRCGVEAPTKYVAFYENVGALVVRFSKSTQGELCKSCIHKYFWTHTLKSATLGWWGTISFFVTPFFLLNNIVRYAGCLVMAPVPPGAVPPELTSDVIENISPHAQQIFDRLRNGEQLSEVAEDVSRFCGASAAQIVLYVHVVVQQARHQGAT